MLMIRPHCRVSMSRPAACAKRNAPVRLMSTTFCHCASVMSSGSAAHVTPALLTRMSTRPYAAIVRSTTDWTSAAFETSQSAPSTVKPCLRILATVGVSHSSRRAHSISDAPASASPSAISCPIPRDPPVTIAMRPSSLNNSLMLGTLSSLYLATREAVNRAKPMTQAQAPVSASGGQFLTRTADAADVFVREDLSEEQRLFGQTAAEFMHKEVLPVVDKLYQHDWALTRELLKKASDLDLLRLEIPPAYGGVGVGLVSGPYSRGLDCIH